MTEYHEHSRILQANFRNMTLRDKGRGDRRGTESVAEEKFSIVFQADIIVRSPACEFTVTAQTLSLPVVVISHGKQEANAAATIFWDNAFSEEVNYENIMFEIILTPCLGAGLFYFKIILNLKIDHKNCKISNANINGTC